MQTSLSPSVGRAFLGCQIEKVVDELNLSKKIISCLSFIKGMSLRSGKLPFLGSEDELLDHTG